MKDDFRLLIARILFLAIIALMFYAAAYGTFFGPIPRETSDLLLYLLFICFALFIIIENPYKSWSRDLMGKESKEEREPQQKIKPKRTISGIIFSLVILFGIMVLLPAIIPISLHPHPGLTEHAFASPGVYIDARRRASRPEISEGTLTWPNQKIKK